MLRILQGPHHPQGLGVKGWGPASLSVCPSAAGLQAAPVPTPTPACLAPTLGESRFQPLIVGGGVGMMAGAARLLVGPWPPRSTAGAAAGLVRPAHLPTRHSCPMCPDACKHWGSARGLSLVPGTLGPCAEPWNTQRWLMTRAQVDNQPAPALPDALGA